MTQAEKELFLSRARMHVDAIRVRIDEVREYSRDAIVRLMKDALSLSRADQMSAEGVAKNFHERIVQLDQLGGSPYFVRCHIRQEDGTEVDFYFSKFQFSEESIYSWIAPAATLRFEKPGPALYGRPQGKHYRCTIMEKDSYMIVGGEITFFSTESQTQSRELIYQKDFSARKTGFILPEIVEQMEKAQDQIIRADHRGSFVISGPAGSGKTTLALHRLAYLMLSPDTAHLYANAHMIVFVQDSSSKEYFSHLLPQLGIRNVAITTFAEWAVEILGLTGYTYVQRYGARLQESDHLEYEKINALNRWSPHSASSPWRVLEDCYASLSIQAARVCAKQKKEKVLDRADLVVLLHAYYARTGSITLTQECYVKHKNGSLKKRKRTLPVRYSLMLIDEFQNYLPQQLQLLRTCLAVQGQGLLYVGDMAQQISFGTLRDFSHINETIAPERYITLGKVYRNTKNILSYIRELGYHIVIPDQMHEGVEVREKEGMDTADEVHYIRDIIEKSKGKTIGILACESSYLDAFQDVVTSADTVYVKSMRESQGLEFDIVCIVGISDDMFAADDTIEMAPEFFEEQKRIHKDLLYVALTRAIDELHVLGKTSLRKILR